MRKISRRQILHLGVGTAASVGVSRFALADSYPARPVHIVVGFRAGQTADILARLIAQWLSDRLKQSFIIDNRPGAASTTATELVVHAPPDGYTLLATVTSNFINATLYQTLPYNFIRDIEPVATLNQTPLVMEVNPSLPVGSVSEFIAYAKTNPGKVNMASGGIGNSTHVAGELFKTMTGVELLHVPYRGSAPALTDLLGGQVQVMFDVISSSIGYIRAGKLRALGLTTVTRSEALPDVPAIAESVPGYEAITVGGIGAPKGTPAEVVDKLNKEINAALIDSKFVARFAEFGATPLSGSPAEFRKLIVDETEKWGKVIRAGGIKAE